jgi:hypothetical protein
MVNSSELEHDVVCHIPLYNYVYIHIYIANQKHRLENRHRTQSQESKCG